MNHHSKDHQVLEEVYTKIQRPVYDFGGGEYPMDGDDDATCTVVDIMPLKEFRRLGWRNLYVQADLNKFVKLAPGKEIFSNQMVKYIKNHKVLAQNIYKALIPGAMVRLNENYFNGWADNYRLVDELKALGMTVVADNPITRELSDILTKAGVKDIRTMTKKQANILDNKYDGMGELSFMLRK